MKYRRQQRRTDDYHKSASDRAAGKTVLTSWLTVLLTAVIAIAGIAQYCIFSSQLIVMQGQLNEMRSSGTQTDQLIRAAISQAQGTQKTAEAMAQQIFDFENAQRAFLSFKSMEDGQTNYSDGLKIEFTPRISNDGNTPTFNAIGRADCNLSETWDFEKPPARFDVTPHSSFTLQRCQITLEESQAAYDGRKVLNVFGEVSFSDIFGKKHRFEFCKRLTLLIRTHRSDPQRQNAITTSTNCTGDLAEHNCSDDQCKDR